MRLGKLEQCFSRSCPERGPQGGKLGACEKIPNLFEGRTILQGDTHQTSDDVERDGL